MTYNLCKCDSIQCELKNALINTLIMLFLVCKTNVHFLRSCKLLFFHQYDLIPKKSLLQCCSNDNHPQKDLTTIGYRQVM